MNLVIAITSAFVTVGAEGYGGILSLHLPIIITSHMDHSRSILPTQTKDSEI
jgi:hypothetical protein